MESASDWRDKARELLPELTEEINEAQYPAALWDYIGAEFDFAYEEQPPNEDFIRRVYAYAGWCVQQEQDPKADAFWDLFTCVAIQFWEPLPTNPAARADMPRWFTRSQIEEDRQFFEYLIGPGEFEELLALFDPEPPPSDKQRRRAWRRQAKPVKHPPPRQNRPRG